MFVNEGLRYELKSYSAKTVKLTAPETGVYTGEVAVPSTFVDEGVTYTVVEVDKNAFANSTVTTVTLPATVTAIGKEAFKNIGRWRDKNWRRGIFRMLQLCHSLCAVVDDVDPRQYV